MMVGLGDALGARDGRTQDGVLAGRVVQAPAPGGPVGVTLDSEAQRVQHDVDAWSPYGAVFPAVGDRVWVVRTDDGDLAVVGWQPPDGTGPGGGGAGQITAGDGLTKAGQVLSVADDGVSLESKVTGTLPIVHGGTGATTASAARTALAATGKYTSATHAAGTTILIPASVHSLTPTPDLVVSTRMVASGEEVLADTSVSSNGMVTIVFGVSQSANTIRITIIG